MEIRIPKENAEEGFPKKCVVCYEESVNIDEGCTEIKYQPISKPPPGLRNFVLKAPLCKKHVEDYNKGKKIVKFSMILMFSALIPFLIGMIFVVMEANQNYYYIIPFAFGFALGITGYLLLGPANKKLAESRSKFYIKLVTAEQIIINVSDEKLGELLKSQSKKWKNKI